MNVVGGTYYECVLTGHSANQLRGSGLRAVAALANLLSDDVTFHTCVAEEEIPKLEACKEAYCFEPDVYEIPETLAFNYLHPLRGDGYRPVSASSQEHRFEVDVDAPVLYFGMIEATPVVDGSRVVYDPQNAIPQPFSETGSAADELALVLNREEGRRLTDRQDPVSICQQLVEEEASVVVMKCGTQGAYVYSDEEIEWVAPYKTDEIHPIGSGDVFSAVFFREWADKQRDPCEAAKTASLYTAFYCRYNNLPFPSDPSSVEDFNPEPISASFNPGQVYLAGPFFDMGRQIMVIETKMALEKMGADVFSPYHDVGLPKNSYQRKKIARKDLGGLETSDVVLALLDDPDRGTSFEMGYARDSDLPVIGYANDLDRNRMLMLEGTDCFLTESFSTAIYRAVWAT